MNLLLILFHVHWTVLNGLDNSIAIGIRRNSRRVYRIQGTQGIPLTWTKRIGLRSRGMHNYARVTRDRTVERSAFAMLVREEERRNETKRGERDGTRRNRKHDRVTRHYASEKKALVGHFVFAATSNWPGCSGFAEISLCAPKGWQEEKGRGLRGKLARRSFCSLTLSFCYSVTVLLAQFCFSSLLSQPLLLSFSSLTSPLCPLFKLCWGCSMQSLFLASSHFLAILF